MYQGKRCRPTLLRSPTEANLRRARQQLADIKDRIRHGLFNFAEEFPEYKHGAKLTSDLEVLPRALPPEDPSPPDADPTDRICNDVFDAFLDHCEMRVTTHDLAYATLVGYRKILNRTWRPKLGKREFKTVLYSELVQIAAAQRWKTKKTYNNGISPLRCAFEFGYKDHPHVPNPAGGLDSLRITKKDLPKIDPFSIDEAESIIAAMHTDWGEAQGNYDEFRFFTGLRPSEQIALLVSDCDLVRRKISVTKARVMARDKDRTKTSEDRLVELCPRALAVLKRQLALRAGLKLAGRIDHEHVFVKEDGGAISNLQYPWVRWRRALRRLKVRYRDPYNARHSSVSWQLMCGANPLRVAKNHGHSVQTMLEIYAAWIEGAGDTEVAAIKAAMESEAFAASHSRGPWSPLGPLPSPEFASGLPVDNQVLDSEQRASTGLDSENSGGERGIRTLEGLLTLTPLAGVRLRPLGHLSASAKNLYISIT